ncbi:Visual system homeobox 2 [Mactra antiquata]
MADKRQVEDFLLEIRVIACVFAGMHKKSIEAQTTLEDGDGNKKPTDASQDEQGNGFRLQKDVRSESIAALRAKALEHSAKITQSEYNDDDSSGRRGALPCVDDTVTKDHSKYKSMFEEPTQENDIVSVV